MKQWLLRGLRLALAVVPLWWIADRVDLGQLGARLSDLHPLTLVLAAVAPLAANAVGAVRWRVLMRVYGAASPPSFWTLLRHVMVGAYFNLLPGAVAGDGLRAYRTRHVLGGTLDSVTVVFVERLCGLAGLLSLGVVALMAGSVAEASPVRGVLLAGCLCATLAIVAVLFGPRIYARYFPAHSGRRFGGFLDSWIRRVPPPVAPAGLGQALGLSLVTQGIAALQILALLGDLAPEVPWLVVLPLLPLVVFLSYFPITPAAIGQRELVFVKVLAGVGVAAEASVTVSLIVFACLVLGAAVGGAIYLLEGPGRASNLPSAAPGAGEGVPRRPAREA